MKNLNLPKVSIVFGTRPECIKLAPLVRLFKQDANFITNVCFTGQHNEMVLPLFEIFDFDFDVNLNLMSHNQTLSEFSGKAMLTFDSYIKEFLPDYIIVQGDTSTVLIVSIVAFYNKVKVIHIEAGLRTFNKFSPFPEEMNRVLTTKIADYHFAPTEDSRKNLINEGVVESSIFVTGNTSIDALLYVKSNFEKLKHLIVFDDNINGILNNIENKIILITAHRRENLGENFYSMFHAIKTIANKYRNVQFIYPVHLNPNVRDDVFRELSGINNIHLIAPIDYVGFIYLMNRSFLILTDSGGIQEEAPSLDKPVLVLRESTERMEGVNAGVLKLVGTKAKDIIENFEILLEDENEYNLMASKNNPFGNGTAALTIYNTFINMIVKENL